tara:strand:- start:708 stop:1325 length:618 start_codon:yes stop_codon:yes gene_type:complete
MAISKTEAAMYAYITGRVLPKGTTRTAFKALVGTAIRAAQLASPRLAAAYGPALAGTPAVLGAAPAVTGAALGLGALATPPGQALLEAAEASGRESRDRFDVALEVLEPEVTKQKRRAKQTMYNKMVKVGMAALKASKYNGKKGKVRKPKDAFALVNRVASSVNRGKSVAKTGPRGLVARAIRKKFPIRRKSTSSKGSYTIKVRK